MKRLIIILLNIVIFLGLLLAMPFVFVFYFFIIDYENNKELFRGDTLFKFWE